MSYMVYSVFLGHVLSLTICIYFEFCNSVNKISTICSYKLKKYFFCKKLLEKHDANRKNKKRVKRKKYCSS